MTNQQRDNSGALFKNDRMREGKNDPPYNGSITVAGSEYWISAWVKNAKSDENYDPAKKTFFSLSVTPKQQRQQAQQRRASAPPPPDDDTMEF